MKTCATTVHLHHRISQSKHKSFQKTCTAPRSLVLTQDGEQAIEGVDRLRRGPPGEKQQTKAKPNTTQETSCQPKETTDRLSSMEALAQIPFKTSDTRAPDVKRQT